MIRAFWVVLYVVIAMQPVTALAYMPQDTAIMRPKPFQQWKTLETDHFRINYQEQHLAFSLRIAHVAEIVYGKLSHKLQWQPVKKTEVVVNDSFDDSNGGATVLPYNQFYIYMTAPVDGELLDNSPWIEQVFTHELVHILHLDQATGAPAALQSIFGRFLFLFPQIFSPRWVTEGVAVYEETDEVKRFGRGQSALYDGMMRAEVVNGLRSFTEVSYHGNSATDWPSGQVYLYGYYFFEFLEKEYGKEKAVEYLLNWNKNIIPWRMDARARQVFHISADELWKKFQTYLNNRFSSELESSLKVEKDSIVNSGRINTNPMWMKNGDFYYYRNDGHKSPTLQKINRNGDEQTIADIRQYQYLDAHSQAGILLSRFTICNNTEVFSDLYRLNESGHWQRLTHCGRYVRMAWSRSGKVIAAVKLGEGLSELVLLNEDGELLQRFGSLPAGESIGHINWSSDDKQLIAAVRREKSGWNIESFDLQQQTWTVLTDNPDIEQKPRFSKDGKAIYFISDQNDHWNLRRLNVSDGIVSTVASSQTAILDYSLNDDEDEVRVAEYTANGVMIRQQKLEDIGKLYKAKITKETVIQSIVNESEILPSSDDSIKNYSPMNTLAPTSWFATLYSDSQDNAWLQFMLSGEDVLGFHQWQFAPVYYFDKKQVGGSAVYVAFHRLALLVDRTIDTVRDSDQDILGVWDEKDRYQLVWQQPFNGFDGTFELDFGIGKEDVTRVIEDAGDYQSYEDNLAGLSLNWFDYDVYLHSISPEGGRQINANFEHYGMFQDGFHEGESGSISWREYISLFENHVLSLRVVLGKADDSAKPFELGDDLDELQSLGGNIGFGRTGFALRGYGNGESELTGSNMRLYSVEYRLPLGEWFDGFSVPPIGLGKASLSVFIDHGGAWDKHDDEVFYTGIGAEVSPQVLIGFSSFQLQTTVGVAYGLDKDIGETTAYLRLGVSF